MDSIRFRQRFQPGDIVSGTILNFKNPYQAWVQIQDFKLLASMNARYPEGTELFFVVEKLYPQIILKEVNHKEFKDRGLNIIV
jgi:hypothetical protein